MALGSSSRVKLSAFNLCIRVAQSTTDWSHIMNRRCNYEGWRSIRGQRLQESYAVSTMAIDVRVVHRESMYEIIACFRSTFVELVMSYEVLYYSEV